MTAHRGCMNIVTESAFKVDSGRTDPLSHLYEYCTWRFGPNHWAVPPQCTCLTKPAHFSCVSLTSRWQPLTTHTYTKHAAYYTHTHTPSMLLTTHTHTPSMLLTTHTHTPSMLLTTHTHTPSMLLTTHTHTPSMLLTAHTLSMLISWQGRQWIPQCHTSPPSPTIHQSIWALHDQNSNHICLKTILQQASHSKAQLDWSEEDAMQLCMLTEGTWRFYAGDSANLLCTLVRWYSASGDDLVTISRCPMSIGASASSSSSLSSLELLELRRDLAASCESSWPCMAVRNCNKRFILESK